MHWSSIEYRIEMEILPKQPCSAFEFVCRCYGHCTPSATNHRVQSRKKSNFTFVFSIRSTNAVMAFISTSWRGGRKNTITKMKNTCVHTPKWLRAKEKSVALEVYVYHFSTTLKCDGELFQWSRQGKRKKTGNLSFLYLLPSSCRKCSMKSE